MYLSCGWFKLAFFLEQLLSNLVHLLFSNDVEMMDLGGGSSISTFLELLLMCFLELFSLDTGYTCKLYIRDGESPVSQAIHAALFLPLWCGASIPYSHRAVQGIVAGNRQ